MRLKIKDGKARLAAKITTADDLAQALEEAIKKSFPKSTVAVRVQNSLGPGKVIYIFFAVAGSKSEVTNGIWENDISMTKIHIYGVNDDGTLKDQLDLHPVVGGSITTKPTEKFMAQGRLKVGLRKKKGTPEQIVKHVDAYFAKLLKALKENSDKLFDEHKNLLKSIKL